MTGPQPDDAKLVSPARPRVLEIGERALFRMGWPDATDFHLATWHHGYGAGWNPVTLGPIALARVFSRVRRGEYDLVVVHPPHYPFWHPRSFLSAFKYTVLRGKPLKLPSVLFSTLAFSLLRFLPPCRLVAVDMSDSFGIARHHHFLLDRARWYFKRELPVDKWIAFYRTGHRSLPSRSFRGKERWKRRLARLRPIAIAVLPGLLESAGGHFGCEKKTDVFFAGQTEDTSTVRAEGIAQLRALAADGLTVDIPDGPIPQDEFHRRCAEAWLTWSPAGYGWDCVRHAEAAVAGSVPVINAPTITRYRPMRHGEHCFFYNPDEEDGLERAVREALADRKRLAGIAAAAREHVLRHHAPAQLCAHIYEAAIEAG